MARKATGNRYSRGAVNSSLWDGCLRSQLCCRCFHRQGNAVGNWTMEYIHFSPFG